MNYKLDAFVGNTFDAVALKAKNIAVDKNVVVEFDFNGVVCLVDNATNLALLYRDYSNAWIMKWITVGPHCTSEYQNDLQTELDKRRKANEEKIAKEEAEYRAKEEAEKSAFFKLVEGVNVELADEEGWRKCKEENSDPYGKCAVDYAEGWAKLMQIEMGKGRTLSDCVGYTSHKLGFYGITGFMYGCAVQMLSRFWKYGEDLRRWHNKEYNHEGEGVVNPAILTVNI